MSRVIFVRALKGFPDSRLEKEVYSLSKKHDVEVLGWDRENSYTSIREQTRNVFGKTIKFKHIGIEAPIGKGFKQLLLPELNYWKALYSYLSKNIQHYDVIHACDFDTGLIAYYVAKKYNIPLVYDVFDYYSESHSAPKLIKRMIKFLEDKIISNASATIICSEQRIEQIKDANPKKLEIIHNTPTTVSLDNSKDISFFKGNMFDNKLKIVYVGTLPEDRYLREIANVIKNRKEFEWHVAGWGVLENYLNDLARESDNIFFYGKISYADAISLESKCDIMTALYNPSLPNHRYAAPNKFYEALMLKKPLIMIKNTGMDKYITDYSIGEVINVDKTSFSVGFERALDNLIKRKLDFNKIGEKEFKIYNEMFSWDLMEERLLSLYENVL